MMHFDNDELGAIADSLALVQQVFSQHELSSSDGLRRAAFLFALHLASRHGLTVQPEDTFQLDQVKPFLSLTIFEVQP